MKEFIISKNDANQRLDKFVTKIVVRKKQDINRAFVDFYLPTSASQFGKIDAILVSNLYTMFETKNYRSDLTEFEEIEWYSDKAWNSDDMCLFKYDDINLVDKNVFDGSFVFTFDCHIVSDGESIVEKYMTEEMEDERIDKCVSMLIDSLSRSFIQKLIKLL